MTHIRILEPAGQPNRDALAKNIQRLQDAGLTVSHDPTPLDPDWPLNAGSANERAQRLNQALLDDSVDIIVAARGGYGATDLLPLMNWPAIRSAKAKPVIGFSDVCAVHSALFTHVRWAGLHAPMPGSTLFGQHNEDTNALIQCLRQPAPWSGQIELRGLSAHRESRVSGWLYGGCLAVLSNLIGTPYMPERLDGAILFIEDVGEAPGRIARYVAQWQHAGLLEGLSAIVLGAFTQIPGLNEQHADFDADKSAQTAAVIHREIERRAPCPVFSSPAFGHVSPNMPLAIGANALIQNNTLTWDLPGFVIENLT